MTKPIIIKNDDLTGENGFTEDKKKTKKNQENQEEGLDAWI